MKPYAQSCLNYFVRYFKSQVDDLSVYQLGNVTNACLDYKGIRFAARLDSISIPNKDNKRTMKARIERYGQRIGIPLRIVPWNETPLKQSP